MIQLVKKRMRLAVWIRTLALLYEDVTPEDGCALSPPPKSFPERYALRLTAAADYEKRRRVELF